MQDDTAAPIRKSDSWEFAAALDAGGLKCPLPVLRARKALMALPVGARLKVTATDPLAAIDMPHFCAESGHRLVASATEGTRLLFLIERGERAGS
jgi:tRNA 2-thiouridine synthesizing protein A